MSVRKGSQARAATVFVWVVGLSAVAVLAIGCGGGSTLPGPPPPTTFPTPNTSNVFRVSSDPFVNASSQHATQVEPRAVAVGTTIVAVFQSGRFFNAGSSDIAFATSHDGGSTWITGTMPGTTKIVQPGSPYDSVSDPSVAFDAVHGEWLAASLPIIFSGATAPAALVNRSPDGITWSLPIAIAPGQVQSDKTWIACDDSATSAFYGHCYLEWDDPSANGLIHMNASTDGGLTWGPTRNTANGATGIGGQPVVQPNGTVIVPIDDFNEQNLLAFSSHDGGASWSASVLIQPIADHFDAGSLRSGPLPSATLDATGRIYVVWQDCRFRAGCSANDLVMSTSVDGVTWTGVSRIPIDPTTSTADHFLPGVGVAPTTSGPSARLGITYFYYPNTVCSPSTCQLDVGFISSQDGGATWGAPVQLAGPMSLAWLAQTNIGSMVGDYSTTVYVGNQPHGIFAVAHPPSNLLDEAMYTPKAGVITLATGVRRSSALDHPIPGVHSDHGPRHLPPLRGFEALGDSD